MNTATALDKFQKEAVVQKVLKEALGVVQSYPQLLSSYTLIGSHIQDKNWTGVLLECTKVLKDPHMKPIIYKQLKRVRDCLRDHKDVIQSLIMSMSSDTDPETVAMVRAGIEFMFAVGGLLDEFKMRKVIRDISIEVGACCQSFLDVAEKEKKRWGIFSSKK